MGLHSWHQVPVCALGGHREVYRGQALKCTINQDRTEPPMLELANVSLL